MTAPLKTPSLTAEETSAVLFDYRLVRDWMLYVVHSVGRHPIVAIASLVLIGGGALIAAAGLPRNYEVKTRLLSNQALLAAPNPYGGPNDDLPAIAAREKILSRESMERIVEQAGLVETWDKSRTPLFRMKDELTQKLTGRWSDDERAEMMVGTLEKRLKVKADKGTIEIAVTWPDPFVARQIVESAQQNFLETRHVTEVATKSETIGVLEGYQKQLDGEVEKAYSNFRTVNDERTKAVRSAAAANAPRLPELPPKPSEADLQKAEARAQEVAHLKLQLRSRQRSIQDLEDWRTRSLGDLRAQLEQQKLVYQRTHPVIQQLESRIDSVQRDSPQLLALRREEEGLTRQIETKGGGSQPQTSDFLLMDARRYPFMWPPRDEHAGDNAEHELARDPALMMAQDALRQALVRAQEMRGRVDAAKIELDSSRAAYKYSFSVVAPPQTPRHPVSPNVPLLIVLGMLAGLLFAVLACTAVDVWRGQVVEAWQIHRTMKLPVLSSVRL